MAQAAVLPGYSGLARSLARRLESLADLLWAELAPHSRRTRNTIRMALIGVVGAGLIASCHVESALGTYVVWTMVGSPAPMMSFSGALGYTIAAGTMMALSVPIAAILAETPWLMLPFVGALMSLLTYLLTTRRFGSPGLVLKVVVLDTFYNVVFHPNDFAAATASTFGGTALAFATVAVFDSWLWPNPAEAILLESLAEDLERTRRRMIAVADAYLAPDGRLRPPAVPPISAMPGHLELLERVASEGASPFRQAILLAAISRCERLHSEVDRMTVVAMESLPGVVLAMLRDDLRRTVDTVADALAELADETPREIPIGPDLPPSPAAARVKPAMEALDAATLAARPSYLARAGGDEVVNFAAFVASLERMGELVGRRLDMPPRAELEPRPPRLLQPLSFDPSLARYSIKVGLATILGYVVGVTSHHDNLSVILTTIMIAGLPTYGASVHKMILRLAGNTIGGALAILAIVVTTPNFESLPSYMIACAIVFVISAYAGLSSGRVAYAGKQIGTAFTLTFVGLGPTTAIDGPLYRVWGIILGVMVVMAVFFTIWPEYASDSMLARMRKLLRGTIDLLPGSADSHMLDRINLVSHEVSRTLFELLGVADDARLEGARSRVDPRAVVDACGTLRRIAHRLGRVDADRIRHPLPALPASSEALRVEFIAALGAALRGWLDFFTSPRALDRSAASAFAASQAPESFGRPLRELTDRITRDRFAEVSSWPLEERRILLVELQSYRRLTELMVELDRHLAAVPRA